MLRVLKFRYLPAALMLVFATPAQAATPEAQAVDTYRAIVYTSYRDSAAAAQALQKAVDAFLTAPTEANLKTARAAWVEARKPYLQTEAYRFYGGPIDFEDKEKGTHGPEGRINAWPLNEAYIDYVKGNAKSGIINDKSVKLSKEFLTSSNQQKDEADVTTGYHAIEFLFWGQDFNENGPGTRPASDYAKGDPIRERRRQYLKLTTDLLVEDLLGLAGSWDPEKKNYSAALAAMEPPVALGLMLTGIASLAGSEMSGERMNNALMSGEHKDAQSCFSGTTNQDFVYNARGLHNVYLGEYGGIKKSGGISKLVAAKDAKLDEQIRGRIAAIEAGLAKLPDFEATLKTPAGSAERKQAQAVVEDLNALAALLVEAGKALGAKVEIVPAS